MARRALRPCRQPGCPELVEKGYCDKHKKRGYDYDRYRGNSTQRGYGGRWRRERDAFLKENPLCVHCLEEEEVTEATEVDHIIPHKGDYKLFWDRSNWQSLCKTHHSRKTVREDGGFNNRV